MGKAFQTDSVDTILLAISRVDVSSLNAGILAENWHQARNESVANVGTILNNMAFYGFSPNQKLIEIMATSDRETLGLWWNNLDAVFWRAKGMDRNMDSHVVYKNFPSEVLHMNDCEYWIRQIFMYLGIPKEYLTEQEVDRPELSEDVSMTVLQPSDRGPSELMHDLQQQTTRWSDEQKQHFSILVNKLSPGCLLIENFGFRENAINMMADPSSFGLKHVPELQMQDATDVVRLASAISNGNSRLTDTTTFGSFPRGVRRKLVLMLEGSKNLEADAAQRKMIFKRLFRRLHPGDFKAPRVHAVYDKIYNKSLVSFSSELERYLSEGSKEALVLASQRPGELVRRFRVLSAAFGLEAVNSLAAITDKLTTRQMINLLKHLETHSDRKFRTIAPGGFWHKLQVIENKTQPMNKGVVSAAQQVLKSALELRLNNALPEGVDSRGDLDRIKLKANDQSLMSVGSGTRYRIPENCNFIRSGSYWEFGSGFSSVWFDNTWNFFSESWEAMSGCTWNKEAAHNKAAIFSGDPVPSMDESIRGCQLIDLYIDKLIENGVRYAVWSVLSYNGKPFSTAKEVLATLQWGSNPESGSLYEPSRAQFVLPIKDSSLNKFVAYIDLKSRELILMDMTLPVAMRSGLDNSDDLSEKMPALVEYLECQPSIGDLFKQAHKGTIVVAESDDALPIVADKAFVFERVNPESDFGELDVEAILSATGMSKECKS